MAAPGPEPDGRTEAADCRAHAIEDHELARLLAPLSRYRAVVLAVSGGADSLGLMLLAARWRGGGGSTAPHLVAVTIDHRLRAASADEARLVADVAHRLRIEHRIVPWAEGGAERPRTGLQAAARSARYGLLAQVAQELPGRPVAVATAHTVDDQAETFVMRLKRGSGLDGLAGIPERRQLAPDSDIELVRPLLGVPKRRLAATLAAAGIEWSNDPSNDDLAYERVRVRRGLAALAAQGIGIEAIAMSARRLARARAALEAATAEQLAAVDVHGGAYATIDRQALADAPEEIRLRVLAVVVASFGGSSGPARLDQLERLAERVGSDTFHGETIGGAVVRGRSRALVVYREPGRGGLGQVQLTPGLKAVWDRRFRVEVAPEGTEALHVAALGAEGYRALRDGDVLPKGVPALAAQGLPTFRDAAGTIVAVPQLGIAGPVVGQQGLASTAGISRRLVEAAFLWATPATKWP